MDNSTLTLYRVWEWYREYADNPLCDGGCGGPCDLCANAGYCRRCVDINPDCVCGGWSACPACGCGRRRLIHIQFDGDVLFCRRRCNADMNFTNLATFRFARLRFTAALSIGLVCGECLMAVLDLFDIPDNLLLGCAGATQSELDTLAKGVMDDGNSEYR